ncbi:hypothetical protein MTO96_030268 [Rhipicephalus appendiculatus]
MYVFSSDSGQGKERFCPIVRARRGQLSVGKVIMRAILSVISLVGLVALTANADSLSEEDSNIDAAFDSAAQEALYLGEILRDVAETLAKDEKLSVEGEEYFFRRLWNKTKEAVKDAAKKIKMSAKEVYAETKDNIKKATKDAKDKLKEKAFQIVSELLTKVTSDYSVDETEGYGNFIQVFLNAIFRAADRLVKVGKGLKLLQPL